MKIVNYVTLIIISLIIIKISFNYYNRINNIFNPKKVIYINMDKSKDRKENIERQLNDTGLNNIERFSAIDGKKLNIDSYYPKVIEQEALKDIKLKRKQYGISLTPGGLGCMLSHKTIWEKLSKEKNNCYYLILEDDATVDINIKKKLNDAMSEAPKDWDIIYVGTSQQHDPEKINTYFSKTKRIYGLYGYLINKKGAKKALKYCFPSRYQIDTSLYLNYKENKMNAYVLNNLLIKHQFIFKPDK